MSAGAEAAAVAFGNHTSDITPDYTGNSLTYSLTSVAADDLILVCACNWASHSMSASYNSNSLTQLYANSVTGYGFAIWYGLASTIPGSAANVVISASGTCNIASCAVLLQGAYQGAPAYNAAHYTDFVRNTETVSLTSANGQVVSLGAWVEVTPVTPSVDGTQTLLDYENNDYTSALSSYVTSPSAGSNTVGQTISTSGWHEWISAIAVEPA